MLQLNMHLFYSNVFYLFNFYNFLLKNNAIHEMNRIGNFEMKNKLIDLWNLIAICNSLINCISLNCQIKSRNKINLNFKYRCSKRLFTYQRYFKGHTNLLIFSFFFQYLLASTYYWLNENKWKNKLLSRFFEKFHK